MGNGYPVVQTSEMAEYAAKWRELERRIRELERPTGTQQANSVARLVQFGSSGVSQQGFSISTSFNTVASGTLDVPDGFSSATIMCISGVTGINNSGASGYLQCRASINAVGGGGRSSGVVEDGFAAGTTGSAIRTMTGLVGGTITVATVVWTSAGNWGSSPNNLANTDAIVMFRR